MSSKHPRNRGDLIGVVPEAVTAYSQDAYDSDTAEVSGITKVLIVELKRGGFTIERTQQQQGLGYADELIMVGAVSSKTPICVFVLGSKVDHIVSEPSYSSSITVYCKTYDDIVRRAKARTFHLQRKIMELRKELTDRDIEEVLNEEGQSDLFRIG